MKEGGLLARWVTEPRTASAKTRADLQNLVIDLTNLTAISQQGEGMLPGLMSERGKFRCGAFTKHLYPSRRQPSAAFALLVDALRYRS